MAARGLAGLYFPLMPGTGLILNQAKNLGPESLAQSKLIAPWQSIGRRLRFERLEAPWLRRRLSRAGDAFEILN